MLSEAPFFGSVKSPQKAECFRGQLDMMALFVMDYSLFDYSLVFALIAFAGFVDSIAGGGGLITVPTYLFIGMPPQVLLGTNKLVSTSGATLAVIRYARGRAIRWKFFAIPVLVSGCAAYVGAWLSRYQSRELMLGILLVVIPLVLINSLRKHRPQVHFPFTKPMAFGFVILMALVIGGYDGFFGPGTGSFFLFGLLYVLQMSARDASANARILNYCSNIGALVFFFSQLQFDFRIAGVGIVGSLIGNYAGSHFVLKHADRIVRPLFIIVLSCLMLKLTWDFFDQ